MENRKMDEQKISYIYVDFKRVVSIFKFQGRFLRNAVQVEELDLEKVNDFLQIYDGGTPLAPVLARLTGTFAHPQLIISTQSQLYIYFYSNFARSGRGFSITYKRGLFSFLSNFYKLFLDSFLHLIYKKKKAV